MCFGKREQKKKKKTSQDKYTKSTIWLFRIVMKKVTDYSTPEKL